MVSPRPPQSIARTVMRNVLLGAFVLATIAGLFAADQFIRNRPSIQAKRMLERDGIALVPASAVEASRQARVFKLEQLALAGVDMGQPDESGFTPLLAAIDEKVPESIEFLLPREDVQVTLSSPLPETRRNALLLALEHRDFTLASRLIARGADPDAYLDARRPLLVEATRGGDDEMMQFLLDHGSNPDLAGEGDHPALVWAIEDQHGARIQSLLDAGANVNRVGMTGDPLLLDAIYLDEQDLASQLLAAGADPNKSGLEGELPLMAAIHRGGLNMIEVVIDSGVNLNATNRDGDTAIELAMSQGNAPLVGLLIDHGASLPGDAIECAMHRKDVVMAQLLHRSGVAEPLSNETVDSLFTEAMQTGSLELGELLVELGASAKGKLWNAIETQRSDVIYFALKHGAHSAERSPEDRSPLDFALASENADLAYLLLKQGASPNLKNEEGESWLANAIRVGDAENAELLLSFGACLDGLESADGHTMLEWALARKNSGVVRELLASGADPNQPVKSPASKEFRAEFKGKTFNWHLSADSNITPIMLAAERNDVESAIELIAAGASTSKSTRRYLWPINIAAWNMNVAMQRVILRKDPYHYERKLVIDLSRQRATLYESGEAVYDTRVSTGKSGYRTPTGKYVITDRNKNHVSSIYDSPMPYFQRFSCAAFGIHQGNVPNYAASHGCIRLPWSSAKYLWSKMSVGDVAVIQQ